MEFNLYKTMFPLSFQFYLFYDYLWTNKLTIRREIKMYSGIFLDTIILMVNNTYSENVLIQIMHARHV